jgi:dephospho-CoA kinase
MPLAVKARYADYVIDNSGPREQTEARVREVYRSLLDDLRRRQASVR